MSGIEGSEYFETNIMNEFVKELIGIFEDEREITVCESCNTEYPAEILQKVDGRLICAACSYYGH